MERIAARIKHMAGYVVVLAKWLVLGALIGAVGGFVGSLFHIGVNYATSERLRYPWILYLLPLAGLVIVWLYKAAGVWGKGTNAVIESVHFGKDVPVQLVPVIFLATVLTHLCGGSAGREGAALQIGGGIGHETGKLLHLGEKDLPLATACSRLCSERPSRPRFSPSRLSPWVCCITRGWCRALPRRWWGISFRSRWASRRRALP